MGSGLTTDLYELTMAASYLRRDMVADATFSLFVRDLPTDRGFLVAAGLEPALRLLEGYAFDADDLDWVGAHGFDAAMCDALATLRFTGDVWAIPEGRIVFPDEPLLEVTAPLPEAQLVETLLLNQLTFATALATKAARCRIATDGRAAMVDFAMRRTHGLEAALAAARAGAIAGFVGTSNVEASRSLGVPAIGTMAHSYIEAFPDERRAFRAFGEDFPDRTTFLVDTYDTIEGVRRAIEVADELGLDAHELGVRLDSGDLLDLAIRTRRLLDDAGYDAAMIVASGGLDEHSVRKLLDDGAPIDVFGVGTRIGVSADAPSLDSAYKLVEYDGRPVMKLSEGKETLPGPKQVFRTDGPLRDVIGTRDEEPPAGARPLLQRVMAAGRRVAASGDPLADAATRFDADLALLTDEARSLHSAAAAPTAVSERLEALHQRVRADVAG